MRKRDYIIIFGLLLIFSSVALIYKPVTPFEHEIIRNLQGFMSPLPNIIPLFLGDFGYYTFSIITLIFSSIIFIFNKQYKTATLFMILSVSAFPVSCFVKSFFNRPRPPIELRMANPAHSSFPSGHSFVNACIFSFLIYVVSKYIKNKALKITSIVSLISWILLIGFSRVWLGVHHPTDIIGGYAAGLIYAYIFVLIDRKLSNS